MNMRGRDLCGKEGNRQSREKVGEEGMTHTQNRTYLSAVSKSHPYRRSFWHGLALVPWALGAMIDSGPSIG